MALREVYTGGRPAIVYVDDTNGGVYTKWADFDSGAEFTTYVGNYRTDDQWSFIQASAPPAPPAPPPSPGYIIHGDPRLGDDIGGNYSLSTASWVWDKYLRNLGFTGPLTEVAGYSDPTQEGGAQPIYGRSKEANDFIKDLEDRGFKIGLKEDSYGQRKHQYAIIGPTGSPLQGSELTYDAGNFGTLLQDLAPIITAAFTFGYGAAAAGSIGQAILPEGASQLAQQAAGQAVIAATKAGLQGANLEQVVTAAATAAASPIISAQAGGITSEIGKAIQNITGSAELAQIGVDAIVGGTASGIRSLVLGDNPLTPEDEGNVLDSFLRGATTAGLSTGLGQLGDTYLKDVPAPLRAAIISSATAKAVGGNAEEAFKNTLISALGQEAMKQRNAQELINKAYNDSSRALDLLPEADKAFVNQLAEQDIAYAQEIYGADSGQRLTDAQLREAFSQGKPFDYIDNLYTTEAEAKDIWRATVGTEPTEYDLLGLIGLDTGQVTSQVQGIADDRSSVSSEELDEFLRDIGKGQVTLTPEEQMDLLGGSEVAARNAIVGKYNAFVEDFNTVTATEAQQRWEDAGNVRPMTPDEMFAMLAGNHDTADQIAQRTADFEQEVFNGNQYATQEEARQAAKGQEVFGQYLYNGRIYSVDQEVPYKSNAATREEAVYDAIRNNKGLVEWDGKILKVPKDYDAALKTIENSASYIDAYNNAVKLLGPDAPFSYKGDNFRTKQAFDGSAFTDKGAAALAAYQNGDTSFVFSDGKTYNLPDNFDQIAGDALLEQASIPLKNAALAELLRPEIEAAQAERLQADAKVTVQEAWNNSFGKLGIPMPEPGTEGYESFVSFALGSTSGMIKNAIGASHWLQTFASNQNGSNLTDEQIAEYGDFAGAGTGTPEDIRKSDAYKFAKFLEQTVKQTTPEGQQQYEDFKNKTEGMSIFNKVAMGAIEAAKGNYLWITNMALSEAPEDVLTGQLLARAAYKLTGSAGLGLGINTVVDMAQATGGAYAEQLEQELAKGTPYEVAVLRAAAIAPVMGSLEAAGEFVGDRLLLKQLADSNITGLQTYLKQTGRTLLAESLGEGLSNGAQEAVGQFYNTGKFDLDGINNAIVVGSFVGPAAATISLSPNAASRVVGTMYDGTAATVQDLLNQNPNFDYSSLDRSEPIFDFGGNQLSVSQLGNVLDNNATNPNFTPAGYITNLTNLGDAGYIDVTAPEVALAVTLAPDANTLTTQLQDMGLDFGTVLNIADTKFDNAITTRDEAGSLTGTGQVIGTDPDTGEALVQLPDGSVTVVTNPGAEVGQTINVAPPVTENQVKQIVNEAIGNIQFPAGITTEDVTKAITDYMAANPGLSATDVTNAVSAELAKLPAGLSSTDVENAIDSALTDYATKTDITNAIANIQFPDGVTKAEAEKIVSDAIGKIEFPASLTEEQVGKIVADGISKIEFPQGITEKDVKDVVETATKDFATKTDIENAIKNIQFPAGITNEDVASEIKKYMEANPGLSATDVTNAVATELGKLPDYATPADVTTAIENAVGRPATEDEAATGVYKAIDDAIAGIQFPQGLTKEDVAAEIKAYAEANPGLSTLDVTNAVAEELKKLPAYATPADVTTALDTALKDYATKTYIDDAIKGIVFPEGLTKEDVAAEIKAFAEANPGLSLEQVTTAITTELGKLPDYATPDDVATALDNAIGKPATEDAPATGLYADLAGVEEKVTSLADILGTPAVADDPSTPEDESRAPTGVFRQVADAVAAGESATDALAKIIGAPTTDTAEASGLYKQFEDQGLDIAALEELLGQPATDDTDASGIYAEIARSQAALTEQIGDISATIGAPATEDAEATGVFKLIAENEAAGFARDEAIQKAISDYARDTGLDIDALNALVGTPATEDSEATGFYAALEASEAALSGQISGLENVIGAPATTDAEATGIFKLISDNEAAGLARDEAIQKAVSDYARDTGLSIEALNELVGTPATEDAAATGFYAALAASESALSGQISGLEGVIGSPATEDAEATGVFKLIADNEAAGLARDEAIQKAVTDYARDTGLSIEALSGLVGTPATDTADATGIYGAIAASESALGKQITGVEEKLSGQISGLEGIIGAPATEESEATGVFKLIADNEAAGLSRDNAISKAIEDYARDTGVSIDALSGLVGTPATDTSDATGIYGALAASEAALSGQITGVGEKVTGLAGVLGTPATADTEATGVFKLIDDAEAAGIARDDAIRAIIGGPATEAGPSTGLYGELEGLGLDLGTIQQTLGSPATDTTPATGLYGALETGLAGVETRLGADIAGVETRVTQQIQDVATVLGKPAQAVTQADIDLVNQMIQGQVQTDLTYDANQDGVIDQNDIAFLTSITTGTEPPEFPAGTRWAPTGVYGQIAGLGADLTRQLEQQELARQAAAEEAERAAQGRFQQQQQQQRVQQFMGMLTQPGALQQKVQVKAPEVMKLEQLYGGLYDPTAGLFRTPQQQQFFASPYGNYFDGGEVTEDELLAIVRG